MNKDLFSHYDRFEARHIGPNQEEVNLMLGVCGYSTLEELISATVPPNIRLDGELDIQNALSEQEALALLHNISEKNKVFRSYIGMGYYNTFTPGVIQRNVLENPGWYTQYTPYQAEIAQGRLEALLNFQTMIIDLTGLPIANASLLDEATAAAEAMAMSYSQKNKNTPNTFFVSEKCFPQTIDVVKTRALPLGINVVVGNHNSFDFAEGLFGALLQYPDGDGNVVDYRNFIEKAHATNAIVTVCSDLLALALLTPPGEFGADIVVGNSQRFGVPMGYGGPHAAFFATKDEFKRVIPGRIIGVSVDATGKPALRMALQTREQHIRREKATSNICTAQVLLAVIAGMYATYHGENGIRQIAQRVHANTSVLAKALAKNGDTVLNEVYFDTLCIQPKLNVQEVASNAVSKEINFRYFSNGNIGISIDETTTLSDVQDILSCFGYTDNVLELIEETTSCIQGKNLRTSPYLTHQVFNKYHSETEMLRYIRKLESRDLSLTTSMIPLGSCTMKLNATSEMFPVTWAKFGAIHPFVPRNQAEGYTELFNTLETALREITGFAKVSLQPNAGSQGEYAGLLAIRGYHLSRGDSHRNVCLIPQSAHGTNPASAVMAGMKVVVTKTDENGNIDIDDLRAKAEEYSANLSSLMVTYPSTHGVFEQGIKEICNIIHQHGGQVYMDGANMNAQVGLCRPGDFGADVCHLNLHKTFCIPHGGGGPGMGPIGVAAHLAPFLPNHSVIDNNGGASVGAVSAAPWGSSSILVISWMYIYMMGANGLKRATEIAILNANYLAKKLEPHYPVLYKGTNGTVAHECILDFRQLKMATGVEVEDVAKRLMDYNFHAPTVSFPVAGTLMVEPTESESLDELDRFITALISIRHEVQEIENGISDKVNNVLKNAPHTQEVVCADTWDKPYTRTKAAFAADYLKDRKFWASVSRVNNAQGDRNLVCACLPIEAYQEEVSS